MEKETFKTSDSSLIIDEMIFYYEKNGKQEHIIYSICKNGQLEIKYNTEPAVDKQ